MPPSSWLHKIVSTRLFRRHRRPAPVPAAVSDWVEEDLGRRLLGLDGGLGLFRWVHLLDAFRRAGPPRTVVSIGSGEGLHEALLARRFPSTEVCGVDLRRQQVELDLPNLRYLQWNLLDEAFSATLPISDFVCSIECLEHIENDRSVFAKMVDLVRPGGSIYVEVPFASEAECADEAVCRRELEAHEHVRPGYPAARLAEMAREHGLVDVRIGGSFWFPVQPMVWLAQKSFDSSAVAAHWRTFLAVAELDLREGVPESRAEATGIKLLARRPLP